MVEIEPTPGKRLRVIKEQAIFGAKNPFMKVGRIYTIKEVDSSGMIVFENGLGAFKINTEYFEEVIMN